MNTETLTHGEHPALTPDTAAPMEPTGTPAAIPIVAIVLMMGVIIAIVVTDSLFATVIGAVLDVACVGVVAMYVMEITAVRRRAGDPPPNPAFEPDPEAHEEVSPYDIPRGARGQAGIEREYARRHPDRVR